MDNLATHKAAALYEVYPPQEAKRIWDRFEFIYTPKHGSRLNMAEIELNVLIIDKSQINNYSLTIKYYFLTIFPIN